MGCLEERAEKAVDGVTALVDTGEKLDMGVGRRGDTTRGGGEGDFCTRGCGSTSVIVCGEGLLYLEECGLLIVEDRPLGEGGSDVSKRTCVGDMAGYGMKEFD